MSTIAVDFDHTLCDSSNIPPGKRMGEPLPGAKDSLVQLRENGHTIIIHTCRANDGPRAVKVVEDWLNFFEVPFDSVWTEVGKVVAEVYIDDKGLHFTGWEQILDELRERGMRL